MFFLDKWGRRVLTVCSLVVLGFSPIRAAFSQAQDVQVVAGQYIVVPYEIAAANGIEPFDPGFLGITKELAMQSQNFLVESKLLSANGAEIGTVVNYDQDEHLGFCQTLKTLYPLQSCEPNAIVQLDVVPNDSLYSELWGMENIQAPQAWNIHQGSSDVIVAVLDTGVDYHHADLAANIWTNPGEIPNTGVDNADNGFIDDYYGWNFFANNQNSMDDHGHGTHCAGTIGAVGNNALGVTGVSWHGRIMPVKFLASNGGGTTFGAIQAIDYAVQNGADIINASFGGGFYSPAMKAAVERARDADVLFVAAAGNSANNNDNNPRYPASYDLPNIISVAATDKAGQLTSFSNYGASSVHVGAPGLNILSAVPGGGYGKKSGTSMAAPHVAGLAALYKGLYPEAGYKEIRTAILSSVDYIPALQCNVPTCRPILTDGRINAFRTLSSGGAADSNLPHGQLGVRRYTLREMPARASRAVFEGTAGMQINVSLAVSGPIHYQCELGTTVLKANGRARVLFRGGGVGFALNVTSRQSTILASSADGSVSAASTRRLRAPERLRKLGRVRQVRRRVNQRILSSDANVLMATDRGCQRMQNRVRFR